MFKTRIVPVTLVIFALAFLHATPAAAERNNDHVSFGQDIGIPEGDTASDIVCAFCSVQIHGDTTGDIAVLFGTVSVDADHSVRGDIAILGGDLNLAADSHVGGDVAIAAGDLYANPDASIRGSRAVFPGRFWLLVPFAPFLLLIGIIWMIIYLIRRNRYRYPVYPNVPRP